ncbi:MAG: aminopeptidase, partial [Desulfobacterales bacterium]
RKPIRDILDQREAQGEFSWTLGLYPTPALAEQADMSVDQYADQIVKACFLNRRDPVAQWQAVYQRAVGLKGKLNRLAVVKLHVISPGCDLTITPGRQRRWIGLSGHNIPSFELFFSPDWRGTQGVFYADQPSYRAGHRVEGVRLVFEKGRVSEASAQRGEKFLRKQLAMDPGASRVGEFSLTDRRFSKIDRFMATTLYDENFGGKQGNCHIALGSSYADAYAGDPGQLTPALKKELGFNPSALHWDLVNTEPKTVTAHLESGETLAIYANGQFQL